MRTGSKDWEKRAKRYLKIAKFYVENESTVRETALNFGVSKSFVHKVITVYLEKLNPNLYAQAMCIVDKNTAERHIRGGESTRRKFKAVA